MCIARKIIECWPFVLFSVGIFGMMKGKSKTEKQAMEKKRKRNREKVADVETDSTLNIEGKHISIAEFFFNIIMLLLLSYQ